ncbi:MAG TPA: TonB-dependent receptor, partial [Flavisolibacter sp.]
WVKGNISTTKNKIVFWDEPIVPGLEYQAATGKPIGTGSYLQAEGLYNTWADLYKVDASGNPILSEPVTALDAQGKSYTNAQGAVVYQKDLGFAGVPLQPGEVRLKDVNFDGVVNEKDYVRSGKTRIPEITFGTSLGFNFKGFDFSILMQGVKGTAKHAMGNQLHFNKQESLFEVDLNRYNPERYANGEEIDFPIAAYNKQAARSTFFLLNTSYVRLKNMEIGYTLQPVILKRAGIKTARVYVNGYNLYTWSPNKIWGDPENMGFIGYPLTRTYNAGLSINF